MYICQDVWNLGQFLAQNEQPVCWDKFGPSQNLNKKSLLGCLKPVPCPKIRVGIGLELEKAIEAQTFFRLDSWSGVTLINFTFFIFSIRLQLNCFLNMLFSITSICSLASIYNYSLPINLGCMKRTKLSTDYLLTYTFNSPKFTINQ